MRTKAESSWATAAPEHSPRGEDSAESTARILALFPKPVSAHLLWPEGSTLAPYEEERRLVGSAAPRRQDDFGAGRVCAAQALRGLGIQGAPLLIRKDRSPAWPQAVVGSISHCPTLCVAVVARQTSFHSLGIDVELARDLDEAIVPMVCRQDEIAAFPRTRLPTGSWEKLSFSAKESIYKCYAPVTGAFLEFHDVRLAFRPGAAPGSGEFSGEIVNPTRPSIASRRVLEGRWWVGHGRVHTGAYLPMERDHVVV